MKTNLLLKQIDFTCQLIAFISAIIMICFTRLQDYFLFSYYALALVQLVSGLFNAYMQDKFSKLKGRRYYERTLIAVFVTCILACIFPFQILYVFMILLIVITPFMAIAYLIITYKELSFLYKLVNRKKFTW